MVNGDCVVGTENKTEIKGLKNQFDNMNKRNIPDIFHALGDIKVTIGTLVTGAELVNTFANLKNHSDEKADRHKAENIKAITEVKDEIKEFRNVMTDFKVAVSAFDKHCNDGNFWRKVIVTLGVFFATQSGALIWILSHNTAIINELQKKIIGA